MSDRATARKSYVTYEIYTRKGLEADLAKLDREMIRLTVRRDRYARLLGKIPATKEME